VRRSALSLTAKVAAVPAAAGVFWLAASSVSSYTPGSPTLNVSSVGIPGQPITISGNNYLRCVYEPAPSADSSAGPGPDYSELPDPGSSASGPSGDSADAADVVGHSRGQHPLLSDPSGPGDGLPSGWVVALLDGQSIGRPVEPDDSGHVSITVRLPATLAIGWHTVATRCAQADGTPVGGIIQHARFRVPAPSLAASPGQARRGGQVLITGRYFWPCARPGRAGPVPVRLRWHGRPLARAHGIQFSEPVTVPRVHPGPYLVTAECVHPRSAGLAGPLARTILQVLPGRPQHRNRHRPPPVSATPTPTKSQRSVVIAPTSGSSPTVSPTRTGSPSPTTSLAAHSSPPPRHPRRLASTLAAWITAGSIAGLLVLLLLLLVFGVPQLRAFGPGFRRSDHPAARRWWLPLAAKPKARFDGRDDAAPAVRARPGPGGLTLSITIRTRPDPRGWTGHTEAIPDAH